MGGKLSSNRTSTTLPRTDVTTPRYSRAHSFGVTPLPVADFRQVLAPFVNILLVLDQLVLHPLLQIGLIDDNDNPHFQKHSSDCIRVLHRLSIRRLYHRCHRIRVVVQEVGSLVGREPNRANEALLAFHEKSRQADACGLGMATAIECSPHAPREDGPHAEREDYTEAGCLLYSHFMLPKRGGIKEKGSIRSSVGQPFGNNESRHSLDEQGGTQRQ